MKKNSHMCVLLSLLFFIISFWQPAALAAIDNRSEILILHSYSPDYEWTQSEQAGIDAAFTSLKNQYKMRIEYMDSNNNPELMNFPLLKQLYKEKFSNSLFKVIIVTDNAALNFLRLNRDELFPGVPVVFCGINGYEDSMINGLHGFTGIAEDNDFLGLFNVIEKIHPHMKRIVIYGIPTDPTHIANVTSIKKLLPDFHRNFQVEIREFPDLDSCIDDALHLPQDSVILMIGSMHTIKGEGINLQRANEIMSEAVQIPIYTAWDFALGHGTVGGRVISGEGQGRQAGEIALKVLNGTSPDNISVSRYVSNIYMFDYNQLTRFGLQNSQLPSDSLVIHSPETTYQVSREITWAVSGFLIFLFLTIFVLIYTIRQRRKVEAALLSSEEKFSKAFKYCADIIGIATLDDGRYIEVSEAFFNTFGYTRSEVLGKISTSHEQDLLQNKHFPLWVSTEEREKLFHQLKTDGFFKNLEAHWCTKSGEIRIGLYSAEVVEISGEACIVYAWHDITNRKHAEEALQQAYDQLEYKVEQRTQELSSVNQELIAINEELQSTNWELGNEIAERRRVETELSNANQKLNDAIEELKTMQDYLVESAKMAALGNLVAGIAHEVNTPIGIGLTAASHLQELTNEFDDLCNNGTPRRQDLTNYLRDLHESSTIILKNMERAGKLIQSFKQVSADQSGEFERVFNVKSYLEEILLSLQPKLKSTNHHIIINCSEALTFKGFPGALSQVLTNLIVNSLNHGYNPKDEGHIYITVKVERRAIILTYSDDGKGMESQVLSKIFDPFYTTKRGHGGTGLGLYLIYNIITQQFKGTITCKSQLGKGTTFVISLPLPKGDL